MNNLASALTGIKGERVALCDVSLSAVLHDLLAEVTVSQTYRNDEHVNIEAVYTFPLPLDAVLLELDVEIGGRLLKGMVVEKKAAEESYEDAVEAGDAAVMLEAIEPGLYTMNVGNLLPQETAKITFSYALLFRWAGDQLRFFLPTTVAPRFGNSPHLPHQVPEESLTVENQFSLHLEILGCLRDAQFVCPSHSVELVKSSEKVVLSLQQAKAVMDRDFVLNVRAPQATRDFVLCGPDGNGLAAMASFQPFFPGLQQPRPLNLVIVTDCSGSMQGDSIAQAKLAIEDILDSLQPHDRVTLIAFGDSINVFSNRPLPCNRTNLVKAKRFAEALDANMGGTEIAKALREAYSMVGRSESADIFLLTDGEVSAWESVVDEAKASGNRIFTVGLGSAVSEAFVRGLAAGTGGECELVSPREGMVDRVIRHFERMRAPRARRVLLRWPEDAVDIAPSRIGAVFEGDTVIACARFDRPLARDSVILEVETDKGEVARQELSFPTTMPATSPDGISTVARVAAAARLKELNDVVGLETALRYRLVSAWTNWLVIAPRPEGEKAQDIPALRKIPQTLAAGWGGVGTVAYLRMDAAQAAACYGDNFKDTPEFEPSKTTALLRALRLDLSEPLYRLLVLIRDDPLRLDAKHALELLREAGLVSEFDDLFRTAADLGLNANVIAAIVLAELVGGPLGRHLSPKIQGARELQDYAERVTDAFHKMADHSVALAQVISEIAVHEPFQPKLKRAVQETLDHFVRCRDLIQSAQEAALLANQNTISKRTAPQWRTMIRRLKSAIFGL